MIAASQALGSGLREWSSDQPVTQLFNPSDLRQELIGAALISLVVQMDGVAQQGLHGSRPERCRIQIDNCLQVAQLVRQADLALSGGSLQLGGQAITHPHFSLMGAHHILNDIRTAIETDPMQDARQGAEHPLPQVLSIHPAAGLITMDDGALAHAFQDRRLCLEGLVSSPLHDLVDPTLADFHSMQVEQSRLSALIAHVLFLAIVHHRRFQPGSKDPLHLQACWRLAHLKPATFGTAHLILPHFDHFRFGFRQFGDLVHIYQPPAFGPQIGLTMRTNLRLYLHKMIRLRHKLALVFLMPGRWSMPTFLAILRQVDFLIPRWRLGRIPRIRRRLLALLQFQFQGFVFCSQCFQLGMLCQDQFNQLFTAHLSQIVLGHCDPILPNLAVFA